MSTKKHEGHPHLTGEHKYGDLGQLILFFLFLVVWITDSFVFHYSNFLKAVFGTPREKPEVISKGVFRLVRHPIYTGALLFYLTAILSTLSMASFVFWLLILGFYIFICRYEEHILAEAFGNDYLEYKKKTGMLFPKLF